MDTVAWYSEDIDAVHTGTVSRFRELDSMHVLQVRMGIFSVLHNMWKEIDGSMCMYCIEYSIY